MSTDEVKLITFKQLLPEFGITDSRTTIDRKEKAKQFPQRVRQSNSRIAWYEHEICEHVASLPRGNADDHRAKAAKAAQDD